MLLSKKVKQHLRKLKSVSPSVFLALFFVVGLLVVSYGVIFWPYRTSQAPRGLTHDKEVSYYVFEQELLPEKLIGENVVILQRSIVIAQEEDIIFERKDAEGKFWTIVPTKMKYGTYEYMVYQGLKPTQKTEYPWSYIAFMGTGLLAQITLFGFFIFLIWSQYRQMSGIKELGKYKKGKRGIKPVTFHDVAGIDEAVQTMKELVADLKGAKQLKEFGSRTDKGYLLHGPPGTGKTLLAQATANEAGVPFFPISASAIEGMLVGAGASKIREVFEEAQRVAPAIVFFDEFEIVGRKRGEAGVTKHASQEQTTAQIFTYMDGIESGEADVVVIAATNRRDLIDEALLRPGRFSRQLLITAPDRKGRKEILKVHTRNKPLADDVDLEKLAQLTPGFTGAFLADLANLAAKKASRRYLKEIAKHPIARPPKKITMSDFLSAINEVLMGPAKDLDLSKKEKEITAYHEAGHTMVAAMLPSIPAVKTISIAPHERSLGHTWYPEERERYLIFPDEIREQIAVLLGGMEAEKLSYSGKFTQGSFHDREIATLLAKKMVWEGGVCEEEFGPQFFQETANQSGASGVSDATKSVLERKVADLLKECAKIARDILASDEVKPVFEELKSTLLEEGDLDEEGIQKIISRIPNIPQKKNDASSVPKIDAP